MFSQQKIPSRSNRRLPFIGGVQGDPVQDSQFFPVHTGVREPSLPNSKPAHGGKCGALPKEVCLSIRSEGAGHTGITCYNSFPTLSRIRLWVFKTSAPQLSEVVFVSRLSLKLLGPFADHKP